MKKKSFLTVKEVSEIYGVSRLSVYNWIRNGLKTSTVKAFGKKPYMTIDLQDVKAFRGEK